MITTSHAAGVKVIPGKSKRNGPVDRSSSPTRNHISFCIYLDTIWNHMASQTSGDGVARSSLRLVSSSFHLQSIYASRLCLLRLPWYLQRFEFPLLIAKINVHKTLAMELGGGAGKGGKGAIVQRHDKMIRWECPGSRKTCYHTRTDRH